MSRRTLTDSQWSRIEPLLPGKKGDRGRSGTDNRLFVDAVLWLVRPSAGTGQLADGALPLPAPDAGGGVFDNLFKALSCDPDFEYVLIDATICKVHADATSQKGGLRLVQSVGPAAD